MKKYLFDQFVHNIMSHTGFTKEELFANSRNSDVSDARKFLYKLCKDRGISNISIQNYMEQSGYSCYASTVPQAIKSLEKKIANDPDFSIILEKLSNVDD